MTIRNRTIFIFLLSLPLLTFAASASAEDGKTHKNHPTFPITAADFQARHDARVVKMRAKLEARITEKKVDAEKAKMMRERFETRTSAVQIAINKAKADGTVSKEEAKEVRQVAHPGRHGKRHGHKHGGKDDKKEEQKR
jgi:hypothetical protein